MEVRVERTIQKAEATIYRRTNLKNLLSRVTNGSRDGRIRLRTRSMLIAKARRRIAPSSVLQSENNTTKTKL